MINKELCIHLFCFYQKGGMKTRIEYAQAGICTDEFNALSQQEQVPVHQIMRGIASGSIIIMERSGKICGIGAGLRTKVNVNIGTSGLKALADQEVEKAVIAERYGADTLSELSMGGPVREIRSAIQDVTTLPITTVPIYEAVARNGLQDMDEDDIFSIIEDQAHEGISSMVIHTIRERQIEKIKSAGRIMGVVSKGGSIMASYMHHHLVENPHVKRFDEILEIFHEHDIVLSLGNSLRSGCIHDPCDRAQEEELHDNIRLAQRARDAGVQTIIEWSGGHVRADKISENIRYYKSRSEFPLFVAGPLPIDTAVGYDHIAGCVGASLASGYGADYLCYLTPSEHLGLPTADQVREGLIAFRIAAHIGDSMKYGPSSADRELARCRHSMDWEGQFDHAIDGRQARLLRGDDGPCTMCGDYCAIKLMDQIIRQ